MVYLFHVLLYHYRASELIFLNYGQPRLAYLLPVSINCRVAQKDWGADFRKLSAGSALVGLTLWLDHMQVNSLSLCLSIIASNF